MDLTAENVARVLQAAASRNHQEAHDAANALEQFHKQPGFHSILQDLFQAKQLPAELRLSALIALKNGVERHWRRGTNLALGAEEQSLIRSRLLHDILSNADNTRFAPFQAIIIAKIARNDFPNAWPSLFDDLLGLLNSPECRDPVRETLLLTIIRHIIKEFASVRLGKPRQAFYAAVPQLLTDLRSHCDQLLAPCLKSPFQDCPQVAQGVEYLKCIRRLCIFGFEKPHQDPSVRDLWPSSISDLRRVLDSIVGSALSQQQMQLLSGVVAQLSKLHLTMAQSHPQSFAMLQLTPDLVRLYWHYACRFAQLQNSTGEEPFVTSYILKALLLLRACFKIAFTGAQSIRFRQAEEEKKQLAEATATIKTDLLSIDFVRDVVEKIVLVFLPYSASELAKWKDDGEEWEAEQSEEDDAYNLAPRSCAQRLLTDAALNHRASIIPALVQMMNNTSQMPSAAEKEPMYSALGATAAIVEKSFDFNSFLTSQVPADLRSTDNSFYLLRRRIAILLAQWTHLGVSNENKGGVYSMYVELLDAENNLNDDVVRITAGKRFKEVCDDFAFQAEAFAPHAPAILNAVVGLIRETSIPETKLALLSTLSAIIERMESLILPFADQIVSLMGPLWQELEKEQLMKKAVVNVLSNLVKSLGAESAPLQPLVLPIIKSALEPGSETQLYLLDDALELLRDLVHQSKASSAELLSSTPLLFPVLELDTAHVMVTLDILYGLLLLDPVAMLQDDARQRALLCLSPLLHARANNVVEGAVTFIVFLIRQAQILNGEDGVKIVAGDLVQSGVLAKALNSLLACWAAHQTTGPNRAEAPNDARNETYYFVILSRILSGNLSVFLSAVHSHCVTHSLDTQETLVHLLDEWFSHIDNVGDPAETKLMVLALTSLLATNERWILERLQQLMTAWTSVMVALRDPPEDTASDSLVYSAETREHWQRESPHLAREVDLAFGDIVHTVRLPGLVREQLLRAIEKSGGADAFRQEWLANVDGDVVKAFEELRIM